MVVAPKHTHRRVPDKLAAQLDTLKACCQDTERDDILIKAEATLPERPKKRGFKVGGARQSRREIPGERTFVGSCRVLVDRVIVMEVEATLPERPERRGFKLAL
jgi:hypothetical protein